MPPIGYVVFRPETCLEPLGTTNYLYDGDNIVSELDNGGNVLAKYTDGQRTDEPLAEIGSGTTSFYEPDGLGSVGSLSNGIGALSNTYFYDSFGNVTTSTGTVTNPFRYTGREFDSETGLNFHRARYYDPTIGRFISEDPTQFGAGVNFYGYTLESPTNFRDPDGLDIAVVETARLMATRWGTRPSPSPARVSTASETVLSVAQASAIMCAERRHVATRPSISSRQLLPKTRLLSRISKLKANVSENSQSHLATALLFRMGL